MLKVTLHPFDGVVVDLESQFCNGGLLEGAAALFASAGSAIGSAGASLGAGIAGATGIGAETAGVIGAGLVDAGVGAGLGATTAAITGGDPGIGALTGGLTGGAIGGFGGLAGDALGIGATAGDALVGAGAGAIGSAITGGNPLTGAALGGASGLATGLLSGTTPSGGETAGVTAPGTSAAAIAPPPGVTASPDLTAAGGAAGLDGGISPLSLPGQGASLTAGLDTSAITGPLPSAGGAGVSGAAPVGPSGLSVQPTTQLQPIGDIPTLPEGGNTIQTAWDKPTAGNIVKALGANAGPLIAGGGLLYSLAGSQSVPGQDQLGQLAGSLQSQGQQLSSYLQSGKLPPGAQASIDQATKAAQAAVRSKYASAGMSGSSAEVQDLNNITQQAAVEQFTIADKLLQQGLDATNTSAQIYAELMNFDQQQSALTGQAIGNLATALSGTPVIRIG